jgi:hypothetical protein
MSTKLNDNFNLSQFPSKLSLDTHYDDNLMHSETHSIVDNNDMEDIVHSDDESETL